MKCVLDSSSRYAYIVNWLSCRIYIVIITVDNNQLTRLKQFLYNGELLELLLFWSWWFCKYL